jgi:hypothetical protein
MRFDLCRAAVAMAVTLAAWLAGSAQAVTLRVANQGDAQAMDPHALNEALQLSLLGNVYEPLVGRDQKLAADTCACDPMVGHLADGLALRVAALACASTTARH